jgi:probable F420-dependent oxidoreductase
MSDTASPIALGAIGAQFTQRDVTPVAAAEVERLGYTVLWIGGANDAQLTAVEDALKATTTLIIATGIANVWSTDARSVSETYHRFQSSYPDRFLLGIGAGHREYEQGFSSPYQAVTDYLDVLDDCDVPEHRRVLAALGPRMLKLATQRSAGPYPYLVSPAYTWQARERIGADAVLVVEHKVAIGELDVTRAAGRDAIYPHLQLVNYQTNLVRMGFTEDDMAGRGSDGLVDTLVAQGHASSAAHQLRTQLDAGASHLVVNAIPRSDRLQTLRALAPKLGLAPSSKPAVATGRSLG